MNKSNNKGEKKKLQYQSSYSINLKVNDEYENMDIVQEENVSRRNAIKVKFNDERWRSPEETVEMLKKMIIVVEEYFLDNNDK